MKRDNAFAALRTLKKRKTPPSEAKRSPHKTALKSVEVVESTAAVEAEVLEVEAAKEQEKEQEKEKNKARRSVAAKDGLALAALRPGARIVFQGAVLLCPLQGAVAVGGAPLAADGRFARAVRTPLRFFPVFSPKSNSFLAIEALHSGSPCASIDRGVDEEEDDQDSSAEHIMDSIKYLYSRLGKNSGKSDSSTVLVALLSIHHSSGLDVLEKKFPVYKELFKLVPLSELNRDDTFHVDGFHPVMEPNHPHPTLEIPESWSSIGEEAVQSSSKPVVCIVGSKGLGKSTLSRFMVNQLLSKYPKVAFLDCDLGQPELTVSGQVSLHVLDSPLLGPAFTNMKPPFHSCYLGATSPKNDPDCYSASISQLWNIYQTQVPSNIPLVINTDGWVKGMGFDLLIHSLKEIRPTHLIQLNLDPSSALAASKNIRDDLSLLLNSPENSTTQQQPIVKVHLAAGYDETTTMKPSKFNASDLRNLTMISYFAQLKANPSEPIWIKHVNQVLPKLWNFGVPVASKIPFGVAWRDVRVRFLNVEVPASQTLVALNGSLVGLVADSLKYTATSADPSTDGDYKDLNIIPSDLQIPPQTQNCIGLGIVRGIDPVSKTFYIVTPLSESDLSRVNLIVRGAGVEYPVAMLMDGFENVRTNVPYITYTAAEGVGGMAKKVRTNLQRRKHV
ncbi:Pre-mRNA cleavage complex II protein Clp1-domain-containing protein [Obelidium mucronatum]|nr:Pre-mRNA cleavage complex II protein Clp1-domain-containing protein [Obelidium mucronatum]